MPNLNVFNTVYDLAKKTENLDELRTALGVLHIDALNDEKPALTAAGRLAFEGNYKAVALLEELGASPLGIVRGYAARRLQGEELNTNQKILADYLKRFPSFSNQIMYAYAANGLHELVESLLSQYPNTIFSLLTGYAFARNDEQLDRYKDKITPEKWRSAVITGRAAAGNDSILYFQKVGSVDKGLIKARAIGRIVRGDYSLAAQDIQEHLHTDHYIPHLLAQLGHDDFVSQHESIDKNALTDPEQSYELLCKERIEAIILGYLYANNQAKVEEYRSKYAVSADVMKDLHQKTYERNGINIPQCVSSEQTPSQLNASPVQVVVQADPPKPTPAVVTNTLSDFSQTIEKLNRLMASSAKKSTCEHIIQAMHRLKQGQENYWNPYWMGSEAKLNKIIAALNSINTLDDLDRDIQNSDSELYGALNSQRLLPITFLGQFGFNSAKTLMNVQESVVSLPVAPK